MSTVDDKIDISDMIWSSHDCATHCYYIVILKCEIALLQKKMFFSY